MNKKNKTIEKDFTPIQLRIPVEIEKMVSITDEVYTFNEVIDYIDLRKYCVKEEINLNILNQQGLQIETREIYTIEYLEEIAENYVKATGIEEQNIVRGKGHHRTIEERYYLKLLEYISKLKRYSESIEICGESRNSYSKTDKDATFMRVKSDYMGNDQLLPAYNMQIGVCDEYVAVVDAKQYASDMECFIPLIEKFKETYGKYPKYPVADAGYGSYNNYLYCEEKGMEKYMKYTMYNKESTDPKYRDNAFRSVNFETDSQGKIKCPGGKTFNFKSYKAHKRK